MSLYLNLYVKSTKFSVYENSERIYILMVYVEENCVNCHIQQFHQFVIGLFINKNVCLCG